jgi:carbon-monoxide dehydrogenase medium subunit
MTALTPDEIITEIRLPAWPKQRLFGFAEFARRHGDFALAGVALFYDCDSAGRARNAHVGVIGAADRPLRLAAVEDVLNGSAVDETIIAAAVAAARTAVDPPDDIHASGAYRRSLIGTMVEQAIRA